MAGLSAAFFAASAMSHIKDSVLAQVLAPATAHAAHATDANTALSAATAESQQMTAQLSHVLPLTVLCIIGLAVPLVLMGLSWFLGKNNPNNAAKQDPYECGLDVIVGSADERFSVKFYLIAMLFLVFDLEVAFLYPFAISYTAISGWGMFVVLMVFLLMLEVGYVYLYKKGALDWDK